MKYFVLSLFVFTFCSCDSMEINAQEEIENTSPCTACEECGEEILKAEEKPTS